MGGEWKGYSCVWRAIGGDGGEETEEECNWLAVDLTLRFVKTAAIIIPILILLYD